MTEPLDSPPLETCRPRGEDTEAATVHHIGGRHTIAILNPRTTDSPLRRHLERLTNHQTKET